MFQHDFGKSILNEKSLKYNEKDVIAIRKHYHQHYHQADSTCFSFIGSAANGCHLKLKESLVIEKLNPSLNVTINQFRCTCLVTIRQLNM